MSKDTVAANQVTLEVLDPRGVLANPKRQGLFAPRLSDLNGKRIAILSMGSDSAAFFDAIGELLKAKYPAVEIIQLPSMGGPASPDNSAEVAAICDAWLDGVKAAGTGTRHDTSTRMERRGKPGVAICSDCLLMLKKMQSDFNGMPTCRVVTVPATDYLSAKCDTELMKTVAAAAFDDIVKALTSPLTKEEQEVEDFTYDYSPKRFTGDDYAEANEKFQSFFAENFMTDGMPAVPPTREAVASMLAGTSYPPDREIGLMFPKQGRATVEKIAINAVMAGAKPEYLPVIITIIETITAKDFNQYHIVNEILPITFISGPIIEELGINSGVGYLAPGHRANSTIGRALLMCMINIGWRFMAYYSSPGGPGQPAAYANYVIPENQKENPWVSFAVANGFSSEESTITVCESTHASRGPSETLTMDNYEKRLEKLSELFSTQAEIFGVFGMPQDVSNMRHMLVLHPSMVRQLSNAGFTRESFVQWLLDTNKVDWDNMSEEKRREFRKKVAEGKVFGLTEEDCKPGLYREPFRNPEDVAVIVSGTGAGGVLLFQTPCGSTADVEDVEVPRPFMHKVIHGATLTKAGK
jgi:hypothetical protein